jgi:hypothetical protein
VDYAELTGMVLKSSTTGNVPDQRVMSEPTKSIVRCCEQRKRRLSQTSLLPDPQRIRVKLES